MAPQHDIWHIFEKRLNDDGKPVKYLSNNSHYCAWCSGCLDKYVEFKHAADMIRAQNEELPSGQARSKAEIRKEGQS